MLITDTTGTVDQAVTPAGNAGVFGGDGDLAAYHSTVGRRPRKTLYTRGGKRAFDLIGGVAILVVLAPMLILTAATLRMSLGAGVLFRQQRVGRGGAPFECLKFRTMAHDRRTSPDQPDPQLASDRRSTHKSIADPRHTRVGRKLRKFSLDELPQLWNLVRGDMSLVGPRPELASQASPAFVAHERHTVRPGLTGYYQLSDLREQGCLSAGLSLDERYLDELSFSTDCRVLLRTVGVVVRGTGN